MKTIKFLSYISILVAFIVAGCVDPDNGPTLPDPEGYVAPVLLNDDTADPAVFLPEYADSVYEVFEWEPTVYGLSLATNYVVEIDDDVDFTSPAEVANTSAAELAVSMEDFNNAMLELGLDPFFEHTVNVRIKSSIIGIENDPLYSNVVERSATIYQNSECGDFCTVGVIGSALTGDGSGWDNDVDMRLADPAKVNKHAWTVTLYLHGGFQIKIRAQDGWDDNWGGNTFPSGTGVPGGSDITIGSSGYYKVDFNDESLEYSIMAVTATYTTIGIIGPAQAGGWDSDTDLTQDPNDPHIWTGTFTFTAGEAKFRAENAWDNNWGASTYPSGFGVGNGPNIPIAPGGTYFVYFNDATGEYMVGPTANAAAYTSIGLIGPAQPGGWDNDTDLIRNPSNPYRWSKMLTLTEGDGKFRANDAWDVNWGASLFPGGTGSQNGANIAVPAGYYHVSFNTLTGEYYFLK